MSVSARTFQLLYIVRQRALKDLPTRLSDFGKFIATRRAEAPQTYDRAYISPTALQDSLDRMVSNDSLLSLNNGVYEFEFMGSQMADLLTNIDACSSAFIDGYKEQVVKAVLEQRARLGQPPANQRDVAGAANLSLDSARRGLQTLMETGLVVEYATGRTQTYALVHPPAAVVKPAPVAADSTEDTDNIKAALAGIDDDDLLPGKAPGKAPGKTEEVVEEPPVALSDVLQDDGPDVEPMTFGDVLENPPEDPPEEKAQPEPNPYDWDNVPLDVRNMHILMAKACDMTIGDYLTRLAETNMMRFRKALFDGDNNLIRSLAWETLKPARKG